MANKKRHIHLLQKLQSGKSLSRPELKELERFEGKKLPPGIVDTQEALARLFSVSVRTVQNWTRDGLPRNKEGHFNLAEVQEWRYRRNNKRKGKADESGLTWDDELKRLRAELLKMKIAEDRKRLVPIHTIKAFIVQLVIEIKTKMLGIPSSLAFQLIGLDVHAIENVLRKRIEELVVDMSRTAIKGNPQWTEEYFIKELYKMGVIKLESKS